jgi:LPS sulfotransferase NodH
VTPERGNSRQADSGDGPAQRPPKGLGLFPNGLRSPTEQPAYETAGVVCISARVGSTALVSGLANGGLAREILEIFNHRNRFKILQEKYGATSLQQYVNAYHEDCMTTSKVVFKTSFWDLRHFVRGPALATVFPQARFVFVDRRDIIAQAYSLWKASKYAIWHRRAGQAAEDVEITVDDRDLQMILRSAVNLTRAKNAWLRFFLTEGIDPLMVSHEELLRHPEQTIARTYEFLVGGPFTGSATSSFVRTSNEKDAALLQEIKARIKDL